MHILSGHFGEVESLNLTKFNWAMTRTVVYRGLYYHILPRYIGTRDPHKHYKDRVWNPYFIKKYPVGMFLSRLSIEYKKKSLPTSQDIPIIHILPSKLPRARHLRLVLFQTQQPLTTLGCHIHTARSQATSSHLSTIKKSKLTSLPEEFVGWQDWLGGCENISTYQQILEICRAPLHQKTDC